MSKTCSIKITGGCPNQKPRESAAYCTTHNERYVVIERRMKRELGSTVGAAQVLIIEEAARALSEK